MTNPTPKRRELGELIMTAALRKVGREYNPDPAPQTRDRLGEAVHQHYQDQRDREAGEAAQQQADQ
ncbi:hypothetical protein [Microlunatus sp. Y2014]|uniref:hypothetical protein n=1 Tax=Microlunatus sp. Y2014 TaxID=3418488 RepID=UPI003DA78D42